MRREAYVSPMATRSPTIVPDEPVQADRKALHDALDALLDAEAAREARIDKLREQLLQAQEEMQSFVERADQALIESDAVLAEVTRARQPSRPPRSGDFDL